MSPLSQRHGPAAIPAGGPPAAPGAGPGDSPGDPALAEAATRFEALILGEMLRAMRKATTGGGLARSEAERSFRDLQDRIWAEGLARAAPIGLVARLGKEGPASAPAAPLPAAGARAAGHGQ